MKFTIEDVAKRANTSRSTVSRFLNGKRIREETRQRLVKVIKDLNYQPNFIARNLATRRNNTIAVIMDSIAEVYMSEIILGIQIVALQHGYNCVFYSSDLYKEKKLDYHHLYFSGMAAGILLIGFLPRLKEEMNKLISDNIPVVIIGDTAGVKNLAAYDVDSFYGSQLALNHLIQLGHSNIVHFTGTLEHEFTRERLRAFNETIKNNSRVKDSFVYQFNNRLSIENGYIETKKLIQLNKTQSFTAMYCANDNLAFGALKALHEFRISVPYQVSVIGFDNMHYTPYTIPSLSTIDNPRTEIGIQAMEKLQEIIHNPTVKKEQILLSPTLVIRDSTGKVSNSETKVRDTSSLRR